MSHDITDLVFSGGGVRGCGYARIWSVLEEYNLSCQIKRVVGVSAGSIVAGLIALGLKGDKIECIVRNMNFGNFADNSIGFSLDIYRLITQFGWNKGDVFLKWYGDIIASRFGHPDATLQDVYNETGIEFCVLATCLESEEGKMFSYKSDPNLSFRKAVRMSISIPGFFVPVIHEGCTYVDGGVVNNYPIWYFQEEGCGIEKTLGFRLVGNPHPVRRITCTTLSTQRSYWQWVKEKFISPRGGISNIKDYVSSIVSTMCRTIERSEIREGYWERTVQIDTDILGSLDFTPPRELVQKVIENGEKALRDYLDS
jgi:NTE family protein